MGKYNRNATTNLQHMILDFISSFIAYVISIFAYGDISIMFEPRYVMLWLVFIGVYMIMASNNSLYRVTTFFYTDRTIKFVLKSFFLSIAIISAILFIVGESRINIDFYLLYLGFSFFFILCSTFANRIFRKKYSSKDAARTLLVGNPNDFGRFRHYIDRSNMNINIIGYINDKPQLRDNRGEYLGNLDELEKLIHDNAIDQVFFQSSIGEDEDISSYISRCLMIGVTAKVILAPYHVGGMQSYIYSVGTYPVVTYHNVNLNKYSCAVKRGIDILGSIIGIIISIIPMIICAIAIKIDSKGPVIFSQTRVGKNGRQFKMYKLRSMCTDAENKKESLMKQNKVEGGLMFKVENDPRVTRVGKFIRKTSMDELPQFFNVLRGDMSLVGTRPPTLDEVSKYQTDQWRRLSIRPGITGLWQISGRSMITDFDEVVRLDTEYIDSWNIFLDFKIMLVTVMQVFKRNKGAM
ncbi:sugar transferase [Acetitomaculum ruminis]|nr:sugar transferase [Acetitomaculum ruminis]